MKNRTAFITGASRGIGKAIAIRLAKAGYNIVIAAKTAEPHPKLPGTIYTAAEEIEAAGGKALPLVVDIRFEEMVESAVNKAVETFGGIDILINNAGMQHRGPLEDFEAAAFEKIVTTNITSVFNVGQAVARHMIKRGEGKIVNISSVQSALARPGIAPYTATKGAVSNLTKGMATDWAKYGLQCNAIAPGYYDTPLNKALVDDPEFTAWLEKRTPAGRWGEIPELVGAAVFLSSAASSFVNGHTLFVDGGITVSL